MVLQNQKPTITKVIVTQLFAVIFAFLSSALFGGIADSLVGQSISQGTGFSSTSNSGAIALFGFYLGLFFTISFTHFAFIKKPSRYYYVTIGLLLLTSLILKELFLLALGYAVVGAILGMVVSKFRHSS